jgi:hypothetical protein
MSSEILNNSYFYAMNPLRYFLFLSLFLLWNNTHSQDFKVIGETKDYILKECDSVYYYSHGLPPKDDFVLDTAINNHKNGILKLALNNGKYIEFGDTLTLEHLGEILTCNYYGLNKINGCYLVGIYYCCMDFRAYLINNSYGYIDTLENLPSFSPSNERCINNFVEYKPYEEGIVLRDIKTKNIFRVILNNKYEKVCRAWITYQYKWINNESVLIKTSPFNKYYLVQIK